MIELLDYFGCYRCSLDKQKLDQSGGREDGGDGE